LVADNGGLIGVMGDDGRALSRAKCSGFVVGIWLENDGAPIAQDVAAAKLPEQPEVRRVDVALGDWKITQISGKTALAKLQGCGGADVLILNNEDTVQRPCQTYDPIALRSTGSLAIDLDQNGDLMIVTASDISGHRP
jgi:competence protein ComEC